MLETAKKGEIDAREIDARSPSGGVGVGRADRPAGDLGRRGSGGVRELPADAEIVA